MTGVGSVREIAWVQQRIVVWGKFVAVKSLPVVRVGVAATLTRLDPEVVEI